MKDVVGGVTDYSAIVGIINDFHKRINHLMTCNNFTTFNIHTVYVLFVEKNSLLYRLCYTFHVYNIVSFRVSIILD